jgi:hypothetical protein
VALTFQVESASWKVSSSPNWKATRVASLKTALVEGAAGGAIVENMLDQALMKGVSLPDELREMPHALVVTGISDAGSKMAGAVRAGEFQPTAATPAQAQPAQPAQPAPVTPVADTDEPVIDTIEWSTWGGKWGAAIAMSVAGAALLCAAFQLGRCYGSRVSTAGQKSRQSSFPGSVLEMHAKRQVELQTEVQAAAGGKCIGGAATCAPTHSPQKSMLQNGGLAISLTCKTSLV